MDLLETKFSFTPQSAYRWSVQKHIEYTNLNNLAADLHSSEEIVKPPKRNHDYYGGSYSSREEYKTPKLPILHPPTR
jgi:hypothetical protein